jgi:hypothetical protein
LWQQAVALAPTTAQYRINLVKLLITMGRYDEAAGRSRRFAGWVRSVQYEKAATDLETRMATRRSRRPHQRRARPSTR